MTLGGLAVVHRRASLIRSRCGHAAHVPAGEPGVAGVERQLMESERIASGLARAGIGLAAEAHAGAVVEQFGEAGAEGLALGFGGGAPGGLVGSGGGGCHSTRFRVARRNPLKPGGRIRLFFACFVSELAFLGRRSSQGFRRFFYVVPFVRTSMRTVRGTMRRWPSRMDRI